MNEKSVDSAIPGYNDLRSWTAMCYRCLISDSDQSNLSDVTPLLGTQLPINATGIDHCSSSTQGRSQIGMLGYSLFLRFLIIVS